MEEISIQTSTWNKLLIILLLISFTATASAYYYEDAGGGYSVSSDSSSFYVPEYKSHNEILTQLVAPFLLVTIILQMGLERGLAMALADDPSVAEVMRGERKELKQIKKQAMVMALIISGMLVPTPFFKIINDVVAVMFGGAVYLFLGAIIIGFLLIVFSGPRN